MTHPPTRRGFRLTPEAQREFEDFELTAEECSCYGDRGPCARCLHPGNPDALDLDDSAWEPATPDFFALNKEFSS